MSNPASIHTLMLMQMGPRAAMTEAAYRATFGLLFGQKTYQVSRRFHRSKMSVQVCSAASGLYTARSAKQKP
jgi:hypothetical protein